MLRLFPLLALVLASVASAQTEGVLQTESALERFVLRQHALGRLPDFDAGARPLNTRHALALLDSAALAPDLSAVDRDLIDAYLGRSTAGVLGNRAAASTPLYANERSFLSALGDGYGLELSPLIDLTGGPALINRPATGTERGTAWTFSRGVRAAGHAGHFFAETRLTENQALVPLGTRTFATAPRLANVVTTGTDDPTYDYVRSTGLVGYRDRFVELRAGRDRNRLGFARGSLLLSDYAAEYDHAQVRLDVGPVSAQAVYARFLDPRERGVSDAAGVVELRYGVFHRLAIRAGLGLEVEVFESVLFGDRDDDNRNGFEPAYLVPFALYRAVERDLGSPDNVLLGMGAAWTLGGGYRVYGQGIIDELVAANFFEDAWTNKWGLVLGAQLADPVVPGLGRIANTDLRVEYARIRPYTYSHRDSLTSAVHYGDTIGHPAGPNASDLSLRVVHRPGRDVELSADLVRTVRGRNTDTLNYGSDPARPNVDRVPEPNPTLQGVRQRVFAGSLGAAVRLLPDATAGLALQFHVVEDELEGRSGVVAPQVYLRWALTPLGVR
ncbi:hypothetical protein [Rubrivirga sp. IMCC45206]|uniref:hypothetical protein n=1 Tax=Rubrivirga sp. IMCC45206 TaxID=3391614 RepID=UPI00398FF719